MAAPDLAPFLEEAWRRYGGLEHLASDPLAVVRRHEDKPDLEVAGWLAAMLAFGSVPTILRAATAATAPLGARPAAALADLDRRTALRLSKGFNHRWVRDRDLANAWLALGAAVRAHGGLEPIFAAGMGGDPPDVRPGAAALSTWLREQVPAEERLRKGTAFLLPAPEGPGASKRLHMFLRWMVRRGEVDLGLWSSARPDQLVMPLDTHVSRIARYIGLTARANADGKAALEVTASLRAIDPGDPVRFDFALARLGILKHCPHRKDAVRCRPCPLYEVCRL